MPVRLQNRRGVRPRLFATQHGRSRRCRHQLRRWYRQDRPNFHLRASLKPLMRISIVIRNVSMLHAGRGNGAQIRARAHYPRAHPRQDGPAIFGNGTLPSCLCLSGQGSGSSGRANLPSAQPTPPDAIPAWRSGWRLTGPSSVKAGPSLGRALVRPLADVLALLLNARPGQPAHRPTLVDR